MMKDRAQFHNFILSRELAEVYLLIDNLSTANNKSIEPPIINKIFEHKAGTMDGPSWLEQIFQIPWPPEPVPPPPATTTVAASAPPDKTPAQTDGEVDEGDPMAKRAKWMAKLVRAKDMLNQHAAPASGRSIAFTLMMSDEAPGSLRNPTGWQRLRTWLARLAKSFDSADGSDSNGGADGGGIGGGGKSGGGNGSRCTSDPPTRGQLAQFAYPILARCAARYRCIWHLLVGLLLLSLTLTCLLTWDVAVGTSLVNRVQKIEEALNPPAVAGTVRNTGQPDPVKAARLKRDLAAAQQNLGSWLDERQPLRDSIKAVTGASHQPALRNKEINLEWAAIFVAVLGGTVLPIFYGLLGANAAAVRMLSQRMRDSTMTPRAFRLAYVQLLLGVVIGACVGLFTTPSSASAAEGGLLTAIPLSASALCFVAGFGVEGAFQALEALVRRLFNLDGSKTQ